MCAFKITGPGEYISRCGSRVNIARSKNPTNCSWPPSEFPWEDADNRRRMDKDKLLYPSDLVSAMVYRDNGSFNVSGDPDDWDIISKVRAPKRKHRPSNPTKRRKTPMKRTPNKYFVGKMEKVKRGSPYRIFRRRKNKLGFTVDEICMKDGWKRIKSGYSKVGIFLSSQFDVRGDKRMFERTGEGMA